MKCAPRPTPPDHVCPRFTRSDVSLIEEPEVCENCGSYDDGSCVREEDAP